MSVDDSIQADDCGSQRHVNSTKQISCNKKDCLQGVAPMLQDFQVRLGAHCM